MRLLLIPFAIAVLVMAWVMYGGPDYPSWNSYVLNNGGLLTPTAVKRVDEFLRYHDDMTLQQIVVVDVVTLDGMPIEEYSLGLARKWALGEHYEDNGILFLIARTERQVRIELGMGVAKKKLTSRAALDILDNIVIPKFKEKNFDDGVMQGASAILTAVGGHDVSGEVPAHKPLEDRMRRDAEGCKQKKRMTGTYERCTYSLHGGGGFFTGDGATRGW